MIEFGQAPHPDCPCNQCMNTGEYPRCNSCGGNDGHPREHCLDCGEFDSIPEKDRGCICGFTGLVQNPVYRKSFGPCGKTEPCKKKLNRVKK